MTVSLSNASLTKLAFVSIFFVACGGVDDGSGYQAPGRSGGPNATGSGGSDSNGASGSGSAGNPGTGGSDNNGSAGSSAAGGSAPGNGGGSGMGGSAGGMQADAGGTGGAGPIDSGVPPRSDGGNAALDAVCTPTTAVFTNNDPSGGGKVFTDNVPDPQAFIKDAAHRVCTILYRNASELRKIPTVTLIIAQGSGVADTGGSTTRFYGPYIQGLSGRTAAQIKAEISGVVHHEFAHIYQNFFQGNEGGLIEGMADFVRYRSGFIPNSNRHKGGTWDEGYQTTAFFLVYLDDHYPEFGYRANQLAAKWPANEQGFVTLTGKNVSTLWTEYQASF